MSKPGRAFAETGREQGREPHAFAHDGFQLVGIETEQIASWQDVLGGGHAQHDAVVRGHRLRVEAQRSGNAMGHGQRPRARARGDRRGNAE